jgi:hypothetical protein
MLKNACATCGGNCWNCLYCDSCDSWLDRAPYEPAQIWVDSAAMSLCKGRHEIPEAVDGSIFGTEVDPLNVEGLQAQAMETLSALEIRHLDLYVTGLTVALIAALNACRSLGITVTLWHFNRETGKYYSQDVEA